MLSLRLASLERYNDRGAEGGIGRYIGRPRVKDACSGGAMRGRLAGRRQHSMDERDRDARFIPAPSQQPQTAARDVAKQARIPQERIKRLSEDDVQRPLAELERPGHLPKLDAAAHGRLGPDYVTGDPRDPVRHDPATCVCAACAVERVDAAARARAQRDPRSLGSIGSFSALVEDAATADPWAQRSAGMRCRTCMFFVEKTVENGPRSYPPQGALGRCRRHAPTLQGFPAVFALDWCGDHKLNENRA